MTLPAIVSHFPEVDVLRNTLSLPATTYTLQIMSSWATRSARNKLTIIMNYYVHTIR